MDAPTARNAIVIVSDGRMFPAAAFLADRLAGLNPRSDTDIVVLVPTAEDAAGAAPADLPFQIMVAAEQPAVRDHVAAAGPIANVNFYRFFAPHLLAATHRRVLYLDADIYAADARPFGLFDLDMAGHTVAAVRDPIIAFSRKRARRSYRNRHRGGDPRYFNAGVLLIDVELYLRDAILGQAMEALGSAGRSFRYKDQTALNRIFQDRWLELSPAFNLFAEFESYRIGRAYPPALIHFIGSGKPWKELRYFGRLDIQDEIRRYLAASPWPGFLAAGRTAGDARRYWFMPRLVDRRMDRVRTAIAPLFRRYAIGSRMDRGALGRYLAGADFADVRQGITPPPPRA